MCFSFKKLSLTSAFRSKACLSLISDKRVALAVLNALQTIQLCIVYIKVCLLVFLLVSCIHIIMNLHDMKNKIKHWSTSYHKLDRVPLSA